jgi:uncharacterized damage-inducible protein DinB
MNNLSVTISNGFKRSFQDFNHRARTLSADLTEEQFWAKPFSYGNSFGHLVLHITGNLNYYIGSQLGSTGYIRNRELEFTDSNPPSKEVALKGLDEAVAQVIAELERQTDDDWAKNFAAIGVEENDRFGIFLRCAVHFHHHIGQMIYLKNEYGSTSADPA